MVNVFRSTDMRWSQQLYPCPSFIIIGLLCMISFKEKVPRLKSLHGMLSKGLVSTRTL